MDINSIYSNVDERIIFLKGIIRLAKADGIIADEERIFFRNVALGLKIPQSDIEKLEVSMDQNLNSPQLRSKFIIKFDNKKKCLFFLEEAIQLCFTDGVYQNEEKEEILKIATEMGVSLKSVKAIENWVKDGIQWQKQGVELLELEQ
jgi:DnaJ-domain-containing protein 1